MSSDNEPGPSRRNGHRQEDSDMEEEEEQQQRDVKQQPDPYINFTVERFENIPVKQDSDLRDVRMAKSKMQSALEKLDPWVTMARDSAASLEQASPDDPVGGWSLGFADCRWSTICGSRPSRRLR